MIICVRGSVYGVDAGVDTSLSSECTFDIALSWAKSVKIWMIDDNDGDVGASDGDFFVEGGVGSPRWAICRFLFLWLGGDGGDASYLGYLLLLLVLLFCHHCCLRYLLRCQ